MPFISLSMRSSMRLRFSARTSNSSPDAVTGTRRVRSPAMISPLVRLMVSSAPQHVAAHQRAADQAQQQDQPHRPGQGGGEHALGQIAVMHILARPAAEMPPASGKTRPRARRVSESPFSGAHSRIRRSCPVRRRDVRPESRLPATIRCRRVGQKIERLAAMQGAVHARFARPAGPAADIARQPGDFGFDDLVGLGVEGARACSNR